MVILNMEKIIKVIIDEKPKTINSETPMVFNRMDELDIALYGLTSEQKLKLWDSLAPQQAK